MSSYKSFEELPLWKTAKILTITILEETAKIEFRNNLNLKNQIQRSAISISSNIAEGFERGTKTEFIQFLYIAKGSCGELRSQIIIAKEMNYIQNGIYLKIHEYCIQVSRQINGLVNYLKKTHYTGLKHKKA
jgi:four helix bundle protein